MLHVERTILVQYANSPRLCGIIDSFNQAADPRALIAGWLKDVWNPDTATGWGLDVWGRIVGVNRVLKVASSGFFGFDEADDGSGSALPFEEGIFYAGQGVTGNYSLTDEAYRKLIFAKAAANITGGSIADLNALLMTLFGGDGKNIWVEDHQDMTMTICHDWVFSPIEASIIESSGVLPRPTGIRATYSYRPEGP